MCIRDSAPPVGARLQVGSGFSGECVKSGTLLRCDDAEVDIRVDRESCRALGIRSMLAVPLRWDEKSVGIIEVFSAQAHRFSETDGKVLQRLAETVLVAVNRAARAENLPPLTAATPVTRFTPSPGSVLFASAPGEEEKMEALEEKISGGVSLPRSHLFILASAAAAIFMVLGYTLAPLLQSKLQERGRIPIPTVLASSQPPRLDPVSYTHLYRTCFADQGRASPSHASARAQLPSGRNAQFFKLELEAYDTGRRKRGISRCVANRATSQA